MEQSPTDEELRAFVGPKAQYYLYHWKPVLSGRRKHAGWNWPAFLFAPIWLGYRRMYTALAILIGLTLLDTMVVELVSAAPDLLDHTSSSDPWTFAAEEYRVVTLVYSAICGALGNRWYLARAKRVIEETRHSHGVNARAVLAGKGGTNVLAGFAGIAVMAALLNVLYVALDVPL